VKWLFSRTINFVQWPYWGIFFSQTHTQLCCFHPLGVCTNPPPPVPPFLLTLNQSPKEIAGSDITNCLTSRAETYHVFLKDYLVKVGSSRYGNLQTMSIWTNQSMQLSPEFCSNCSCCLKSQFWGPLTESLNPFQRPTHTLTPSSIQCMLKHLKLHAGYADIGGLRWY